MAASQFTVYKKNEEDLHEYSDKGGARKKKAKAAPDPGVATPPPPQEEEPSFFPKDKAKKGGKFVPLYSKEGNEADVVRLAGRHKCECEAVKHGLVSNCLGCGCGTLVVTREEQVVLDRKSKKCEQLYKKPAGEDGRDEYQASHQKALENKGRLLDYDANCETGDR